MVDTINLTDEQKKDRASADLTFPDNSVN